MKIKATLLVLTAGACATFQANAQTLFDLGTTDDLSLSHSTAAPLASPPEPGSSVLNTGTFSWETLASDSGGNVAEFSSGVFSSSDWGGVGRFTSISIDVSAIDFVNIAGQYDGTFNTSTEFSNFFYQLDGGSIVTFGIGVEDASASDVSVGFSALDVSSADSLVVGFEYSHNGSSDFFNVDSLTVSQVPEPSAYALLAGLCGLGWVMVRRRARG